jgi:hypothetical protein
VPPEEEVDEVLLAPLELDEVLLAPLELDEVTAVPASDAPAIPPDGVVLLAAMVLDALSLGLLHAASVTSIAHNMERVRNLCCISLNPGD